jgi:hypothetical protein
MATAVLSGSRLGLGLIPGLRVGLGTDMDMDTKLPRGSSEVLKMEYSSLRAGQCCLRGNEFAEAF